ncbi:hypothetical protein C8R43DRAFT_1197864 [Mycena crocata]|nr:hypothetical protein C8R43DRAFT_1197864 [Mycena crocata]
MALTHMEHLELVGLSIGPIRLGVLNAAQTLIALPSLHTLVITDANFTNSQKFGLLFAQCTSSLRHVELHILAFHHENHPSNPLVRGSGPIMDPSPVHPHIVSLGLLSIGPGVAEWLLNPHCPLDVTALEKVDIYGSPLPALIDVLTISRPSIKVLRLYTGEHASDSIHPPTDFLWRALATSDDGLVPSLSLSSFPALTTLRLVGDPPDLVAALTSLPKSLEIIHLLSRNFYFQPGDNGIPELTETGLDGDVERILDTNALGTLTPGKHLMDGGVVSLRGRRGRERVAVRGASAKLGSFFPGDLRVVFGPAPRLIEAWVPLLSPGHLDRLGFYQGFHTIFSFIRSPGKQFYRESIPGFNSIAKKRSNVPARIAHMEDDATMKLSATVLYPRTNLACTRMPAFLNVLRPCQLLSVLTMRNHFPKALLQYLWDLVHPPRQTMLFYHFSLIVIPSALWRFTAPFRKFSGPMSTSSNVPSKSQPQEVFPAHYNRFGIPPLCRSHGSHTPFLLLGNYMEVIIVYTRKPFMFYLQCDTQLF